MRADESALLALRAAHLKGEGDAASRAGRHGDAAALYAEALNTLPVGGAGRAVMYANRSLALLRSLKASAALEAAEAAVQHAPAWAKARWRCYQALAELRRRPEALHALLAGYRLLHTPGGWVAPGDGDTDGDDDASQAVRSHASVLMAFRAALPRAVAALTREELASEIVALFESELPPPRVEAPTSRAELLEGAHRHLTRTAAGSPKPWDHARWLLRWLAAQGGHMGAGMAHLQRAEIFAGARCYRQAAEDAAMAIRAFSSMESSALPDDAPDRPGYDDELDVGAPGIARGPWGAARPYTYRGWQTASMGTGASRVRRPLNLLAWAWSVRGTALAAESGHPAADVIAAAAAAARAASLSPNNRDYVGAKLDALAGLSNDAAAAALAAANALDDGSSTSGGGAPSMGAVNIPAGSYHVDCRVVVRKIGGPPLSAAARAVLREGVASSAKLPLTRVHLEGVTPGATSLEIRFTIHMGTDRGPADAWAAALLADPAGCVGGVRFARLAGGPVEPHTASAVVSNGDGPGGETAATPTIPGKVPLNMDAPSLSSPPLAPPLALELPYRTYRLVGRDGRPVERTVKHAYAMSRVYYDARSVPDGAWAQLGDGSCRWRQSAGEVTVLVLRVPRGTPGRHLSVIIGPHRLLVAHATTGETYLEGRLERGVDPGASTWEVDSDDGVVLHLAKMNLELLAATWQHSATWWPRLLTHHAEIAWDDYEKDYSDLPEPIMARHAAGEAQQDVRRKIEAEEGRARSEVRERDELRKRTRQERLHVLRGGGHLNWVELDRRNPAVDDMPTHPGSRDSDAVST